jgi:hypothetical protein
MGGATATAQGGIFNNTAADTNDDWFWSMQDAAGNSQTRLDQVSAWTLAGGVGNRQNFELTGTIAVVPEPATLMLLAIGVGGLLAWRRRQPR